MIVGIGMDLVEIQRMDKAYLRLSIAFVQRILTEREFEVFKQLDSEKRKVEWLSGRFAAKEAIVKAIGTGFGKQVTIKDVEIRSNRLGKPEFILSEKVKELFTENTIFHLTISHTENIASAFVIIEE